MFGLSALLAVVLFVSGCDYHSRRQPPEPGSGSFAERHLRDAVPVQRLLVVNEGGLRISGASVLIGTRAGVPFADNFLTTDSNGAIPIPKEWTDAQSVTIESPGYLRTTLIARHPVQQTITLRPSFAKQRLKASGQTTQFSIKNWDGLIDMGLVFAAIPRRDLVRFHLTSLISPEIDPLTAAGQTVEIPSNLTIPKQSERYIIPIKVQKENYRFYLGQPGNYRFIALQSRFPFKEIVDAFRGGKTLLDIVNRIHFRGAGIRDTLVGSDPTQLNLPVNEMELQPLVSVKAPVFGPEHMMLSLPLVSSGDVLFPSDIKRVSSEQTVQLTYPKNFQSPGVLLSVLRSSDTTNWTMGANSETFSAVIQPVNVMKEIRFLPLVRSPEVRGTALILNPPQTQNDLRQRTTYLVYSEVVERNNGDMSFEIKTPHWEVYADDWQNQIEMPQWPENNSSPANGKYRWEVAFLGDEIQEKQTDKKPSIGPAVLETASHVTRSAIDIQ